MSGKTPYILDDKDRLADLADWLLDEIYKLDQHRRLHVTPLRIAAEKGLDTYDRYDDALDRLGEDALELLEQFQHRYRKEVKPTP